MNILHLLVFLVVAGLAGALGQMIVGTSRGGFLVSIIIGYVGALIGSWLAGQLGLPAWLTFQIGGAAFPFLWAVLGAVILVLIINMITRNS